MAKATVLKCDVCGNWDSATCIVRTVSITGPKFDLCTEDRAKILGLLGVDEYRALAYHQHIDQEVDRRGTMPQLSIVDKLAKQAAADLAAAGAAPPALAVVDSEVVAVEELPGEPEEDSDSGGLVAVTSTEDDQGTPKRAGRKR